jgi:hypothetical protein
MIISKTPKLNQQRKRKGLCRTWCRVGTHESQHIEEMELRVGGLEPQKLEFGRKRITQRRLYRDRAPEIWWGPLKYRVEYPLKRVCEESTQDPKKDHQKE